MSFGTQARLARDRNRPLRERRSALRRAVGLYHPLGFRATWSYLAAFGNLRSDESALTQALEALETSRAAWLADVDAFAARRRIEKADHRRAPSAADRRRLSGLRWPGPDKAAATRHAVEFLWREHIADDFPEVPAEALDDLVETDSGVAGCVVMFLSHRGTVVEGQREILLTLLSAVDEHQGTLAPGPLATHYAAYQHFRRCAALLELIANADG